MVDFNLNKPFHLVGVVIGAIVVLSLLGAFMPSIFTAIADIVGAFTTGSTNNTLADTLLPILGTLLALAMVVGIITLVLRSTKLGGGKSY